MNYIKLFYLLRIVAAVILVIEVPSFMPGYFDGVKDIFEGKPEWVKAVLYLA